MMYVVWGLYKVIEDDIGTCMMRMSESEMIIYYGERRTEKGRGTSGPVACWCHSRVFWK